MGKTRKDGFRGKDYRQQKRDKNRRWETPYQPQPPVKRKIDR